MATETMATKTMATKTMATKTMATKTMTTKTMTTMTTTCHASDPCLPCVGIISWTFLEHLVWFSWLRGQQNQIRTLMRPFISIFNRRKTKCYHWDNQYVISSLCHHPLIFSFDFLSENMKMRWHDMQYFMTFHDLFLDWSQFSRMRWNWTSSDQTYKDNMWLGFENKTNDYLGSSPLNIHEKILQPL